VEVGAVAIENCCWVSMLVAWAAEMWAPFGRGPWSHGMCCCGYAFGTATLGACALLNVVPSHLG
jgi:hypothetical protein